MACAGRLTGRVGGWCCLATAVCYKGSLSVLSSSSEGCGMRVAADKSCGRLFGECLGSFIGSGALTERSCGDS